MVTFNKTYISKSGKEAFTLGITLLWADFFTSQNQNSYEKQLLIVVNFKLSLKAKESFLLYSDLKIMYLMIYCQV